MAQHGIRVHKVVFALSSVFYTFLGKFYLRFTFYFFFYKHLKSFKSLIVQNVLCILTIGSVLVLNARSKGIKCYVC